MKTPSEIARGRIEKIQQHYLNQLTFGSWNNLIYWFLQIVMILFALVFVALAFIVPVDPLAYSQSVSDSTSVGGKIHNDEITSIMISVKLGIFVAGVGFLFAAALCSKVRKRSNLLIQVKSELKSVCDDLV